MKAINEAKIIGGILVIFGLCATFFAWTMQVDTQGDLGPKIFPLMATISIVILGLLEFKRGFEADAPALVLGGKLSSIFALLALAIIYVTALSKLGYLISTAFVAPLAMLLFGIRNPIGLIVATILCPIVYHLIFFELLGVFPPYGEWYDLLYLFEKAA